MHVLMGQLVDNVTGMYPKWTSSLQFKVVCGPIIPSDSQYQHLPYVEKRLTLVCNALVYRAAAYRHTSLEVQISV